MFYECVLERSFLWKNAHLLAVLDTEGFPSNTITRSARYVAMMKSCSTTKPVFLAWRMYLWEIKQAKPCWFVTGTGGLQYILSELIEAKW